MIAKTTDSIIDQFLINERWIELLKLTDKKVITTKINLTTLSNKIQFIISN